MSDTGENRFKSFRIITSTEDYSDLGLGLLAAPNLLPIYDIDLDISLGAIGHVEFSNDQIRYPELSAAELDQLYQVRQKFKVLGSQDS